MSIVFIGDAHGKIAELQKIQSSLADGTRSIQLGDMGFGFRQIPEFPEQHKFIRGNHDDPDAARAHKNYLGDYGYLPDDGIFYISGAHSIDKQWRTPGVSWWEGEELSIVELNAAQQLYVEKRPKIVISHECPAVVNKKMLEPLLVNSYYSMKSDLGTSRTCQALQQMFEAYEPERWYFGHYHIDTTLGIGRTTFQCLAELSTAAIEDQ